MGLPLEKPIQTSISASRADTQPLAEIENLANPVINGPYDPLARHFDIGDDGSSTGMLIPGRRASQDRREDDLRHVGDAVFPGRFGHRPMDTIRASVRPLERLKP